MLEGMTALQTSIGTDRVAKSEHLDFKEINNISNIIGNIVKLTPEITQLERKLGKLKKGARDETLEKMLRSIKDQSVKFKELQSESESEHISHVLKLKHIDGAGEDKNTDDVIDDALKATIAKLGPQDKKATEKLKEHIAKKLEKKGEKSEDSDSEEELSKSSGSVKKLEKKKSTK